MCDRKWEWYRSLEGVAADFTVRSPTAVVVSHAVLAERYSEILIGIWVSCLSIIELETS
jgi:hypothetical protein